MQRAPARLNVMRDWSEIRWPAYSKRVFALLYLVFLSVLPTYCWVWMLWWGNLPVLAMVAGFWSEEISTGRSFLFVPFVLFWALLYAGLAWAVAAFLEAEVSLRQRRAALGVVLLSCVIIAVGTTYVFSVGTRRYKDGNLFESYTILWTLELERR